MHVHLSVWHFLTGAGTSVCMHHTLQWGDCIALRFFFFFYVLPLDWRSTEEGTQHSRNQEKMCSPHVCDHRVRACEARPPRQVCCACHSARCSINVLPSSAISLILPFCPRDIIYAHAPAQPTAKNATVGYELLASHVPPWEETAVKQMRLRLAIHVEGAQEGCRGFLIRLSTSICHYRLDPTEPCSGQS